jgi:hypothetical protein
MNFIENNLNDDNSSLPSLPSPSMPDVGCQYSSSTTLPVVIERSQETFSTSL